MGENHTNCQIDGCDKPVRTRGICNAHYKKGRRTGSLPLLDRPTVCSREDCDKPHYSLGLCDSHWRQQRRATMSGRSRETCDFPGCDRPVTSRNACSRHYSLTLTYKLTLDRLHRLLSGGCSICSSFDNLHIDHDHNCCSGSKSCGKCVRGALCGKCNMGLGLFDDDHDRMVRASLYLLRGQSL